ncbi:MAG: TlyA family RNA methyltransferase [Brevinematia bacterium]
MENKTIRIDQLLVIKKLIESRSKAKQLIQAGDVKVNGIIVTKPSTKIPLSSKIEILDGLKYVSRAGYKLEEFFKEYKIEIAGKIVYDIGSSTGGFVDYFLQNFAKKVYAIDVNTRQLHEKVSSHSCVIKIEKNARFLTREDFQDAPDIITVDVSFISVEKLANVFYNLCKDKTQLIVLIKPQFETKINKKGIVKDKEVHIQVIWNVLKEFDKSGFVSKYLTFSRIPGKDSNIEFFCVFEKKTNEGKEKIIKEYKIDDIIRIVDKAWEALR